MRSAQAGGAQPGSQAQVPDTRLQVPWPLQSPSWEQTETEQSTPVQPVLQEHTPALHEPLKLQALGQRPPVLQFLHARRSQYFPE